MYEINQAYLAQRVFNPIHSFYKRWKPVVRCARLLKTLLLSPVLLKLVVERKFARNFPAISCFLCSASSLSFRCFDPENLPAVAKLNGLGTVAAFFFIRITPVLTLVVSSSTGIVALAPSSIARCLASSAKRFRRARASSVGLNTHGLFSFAFFWPKTVTSALLVLRIGFLETLLNTLLLFVFPKTTLLLLMSVGALPEDPLLIVTGF